MLFSRRSSQKIANNPKQILSEIKRLKSATYFDNQAGNYLIVYWRNIVYLCPNIIKQFRVDPNPFQQMTLSDVTYGCLFTPTIPFSTSTSWLAMIGNLEVQSSAWTLLFVHKNTALTTKRVQYQNPLCHCWETFFNNFKTLFET